MLFLGHLRDQVHLAVALDDILQFVALGRHEGRFFLHRAMAGIATDLDGMVLLLVEITVAVQVMGTVAIDAGHAALVMDVALEVVVELAV